MKPKKRENLDETFEHSLEEMQRLFDQRRQAYRDLVESIQDLSPLDKAEAWLKHIANNMDTFGEQEALVYLVSRGYSCSEHIQETAALWRLLAREAIEDYRSMQYFEAIDSGERRVYREELTYVEASDVVNQSVYDLQNFWGGTDYQVLSIDATMLRTVEWCNIGGFEEWWHRLEREMYDMTIHGGVEAIPASFLLFNMCRSDYAIQLMQSTLIRILEALEFLEYKQLYPWRRLNWRRNPSQAVDHLGYAASIIFVNKRLHPMQPNTQLVNQAIETLLKWQDTEGGWRCWADAKEIAIHTTAMAMHALAITKPRGWELALSAAKDWLWSAQDRSGCWYDNGCPDSVHLTVLVLDALELANGGAKVTFGLTTPVNGSIEQLQQRRTEAYPMSKIKALFLAANPKDTHKLNLDEQIRSITEKIRATDYRDSLELESVWAVRADDLIQSLNEHRPHIVHFSGHGSPAGEILVVDRDGKAKPISTEALKALLVTLKDNIRIVILDACYSKSQAEAIAAIVDCVIGMDGAVGETAATVFTASFYRAIGFGRSVQQAFDQGRVALLLEDIPEEDTPKLLTSEGVDPSMVVLIDPKSR